MSPGIAHVDDVVDERTTLGKLFLRAWKDPTFKERLKRAPKAVLAEHGIRLPDNIEITVVENTDEKLYITLPANPAHEGPRISEEELERGFAAAGDSTWNHLSVKILKCCS